MIPYCNRALSAIIFLLLTSLLPMSCSPDVSMVKEGDIVFQNLQTPQGKIIQLLTHSDWNQCGLVLSDSTGNLVVLEANQQVKEIPLKAWVKNGEQKKFAVYRIKNEENILTKGILGKMKKVISPFLGKEEDDIFRWDDEKLYNAELVYKIYFLTTGIKLAGTKPLKDYDWSSNEAKQKLKEVYKEKFPANEPAVFPHQLLESSWIKKIYER